MGFVIGVREGCVRPRSGVARLVVVALAFLLLAVGPVAAQESPWPDFSKIKPLEGKALTLDEMRMKSVPAHEPGLDEDGRGRLPIARSTSNSSGAPVVCDGPYVVEATDDYCWELTLNENYLAILTTRDGAAAATGDDVQDWLDQVGGNFELAWTSTPAPPQPNASAPPVRYVQSTPNATYAPGDLHIFFRPGLGIGIEKMIDSLVRSRVDDWYFSPMFRWSYKVRRGTYPTTYHGHFAPRASADAPAWPASDFRQLIPALQAAAGDSTRVERVTRRQGHHEFFRLYPADRNGLSLLDLVEALETVPEVSGWWEAGGFLLPGDSLPVGGPSGGPSGGGAATAVPISSPIGQAFLALVLALAAIYWMRRS